ncbi:MAG: hypothetical protein VCC20_11150 [Myxococcota bacterium]|jgi:chromosome segregation ATPase
MASANARVPAAESRRATDLERLEDAVRDLVALKDSLQAKNEALEESLDEGRAQIEEAGTTNRELQEHLLAEAQRRQDALKRIDDLVGLIDQLDPLVASGEN